MGDQRLLLILATTAPSALCPVCQLPSSRIHSRYTRQVIDLPWAELTVRFLLKVRRFLCPNPACKRRTFAERLGDALPAWARRTQRHTRQLQALGLALGGEAGARLAAKLGIKISPDTLLKLVRLVPLPTRATPRVLGLDDWAIRKGQRYGTIVVDLERECIVDLLPDREADTLVKWLQTHPGVEIISRDRSVTYAEAARLGAPEAVQVIDRFHLFKNLRETVEKILKQTYDQVRRCLAPQPGGACPTAQPADTQVLETTPQLKITNQIKPKKLSWAEAEKQRRLAHRQQLYEQVQLLDHQGYNQSQIVQNLGISRRRVVELLKAPPRLNVYPKRATKLDPYKPYVHKRFFEEECHNAKLLWEELKGQGYKGGLSYLTQYVGQLRKQLKTNAGVVNEGAAAEELGTLNQRTYSAGQLSWWFTLPMDKLSQGQRQKLERLCQAEEKLGLTYQLAQSFRELFKAQQTDKLGEWLERAQESAMPAWVSFARGIVRDEAAIKASIKMKWSNGPTEGAVNRVKLVKRSMYGRAQLDLLKIRVLAA